MNIAVCLSGQTRTFERVAEKIFTVFSDADFYFSTWDTNYNNNLLSLFDENKVNLESYEFVKEPLQTFNERKICDLFIKSFPDFFILNQWYGVSRVIKLANEGSFINGKKYDLIVRCRFDLNLKFTKSELIDRRKECAINYIEALTKGSDQFFFGEPELMNSLADFPEWLVTYGNNFGTKYGFFASPLLKAFFLDKGYDLNKITLPMTVLRPKEDVSSARELREDRTRNYIERNFPDIKDTLWKGERSEEIKKIDFERPAPWEKEYYNEKRNFYIDGK